MKRIFILTILTLGFLCLPTSRAAAQARGQAPAPETAAKPGTAIVGVKKLTLATLPTIMGTSGGSIYSVNPTNGTTTHISHPKYMGGLSMSFIGFAQAGNTLYGLTPATQNNAGGLYKSHLFAIGPDYGANRYGTLNYGTPLYLNGNRVYCIGEGDLAYDRSGKSGGVLYATCQDGGWKLITIIPSSGAVAVKGTLPAGGIYSALAFNLAGDLYTLDTHNRRLYKLDRTNAGVTATMIPLTGTLPNTSVEGGMGFSDDGVLYAGFGGALVSINIVTGAVTTIRPTDYGSISGLSVKGGGDIKIKKHL